MQAPTLLPRASAEAFGTFALVTSGCGAIMVNHATGALGHGGVAASFGLAIMVMIAALGHVSGAHFNPAVTLAFAVTRHFPWRDVPSYIAGQLLGAIAGALVLCGAFGNEAALGATVPSGSPLQALGIEILLTAVLMFVIISVATDTRAVGELAAVAIGGTVALDALWGGPVTGASMNPARSFGPAVVAGLWSSHCGCTGWGRSSALWWGPRSTRGSACGRRRRIEMPWTTKRKWHEPFEEFWIRDLNRA